jgi:predicted Zn-dependent protease
MKFARTVAWTLLISGGVAACAKVPVTGRRQFNLIPEGIMNSLGESTYTTMLSELNVAQSGTENVKTLVKTGSKIAAASGESYEWEYKLIQDNDTINAWCLPGGKTAVYTGLLPVAENEAGLAFIMGHEIGHATAHHGAERMSQQLAVLGGLAGLYLYLDKKSELTDEQKGLVVAAMGLGAEVGIILPFSRTHEKEADVIGMMYMAKAGYPPTESLKMWDRMEAATGGSSLPQWLSTHPTNENRQANLTEWMGQAKKRYERNKLSYDTTKTLWSSDSASNSRSRSSKSSSSKKSSDGGKGKGSGGKGGGKGGGGKH